MISGRDRISGSKDERREGGKGEDGERTRPSNMFRAPEECFSGASSNRGYYSAAVASIHLTIAFASSSVTSCFTMGIVIPS